MKLTSQDYEVLIQTAVGSLAAFDKPTSLSYKYLKETCARIIEITIEYQTEFPKEAKRFSDGA